MQLLQLSTLANTGLVLFLAVVLSIGTKGAHALPVSNVNPAREVAKPDNRHIDRRLEVVELQRRNWMSAVQVAGGGEETVKARNWHTEGGKLEERNWHAEGEGGKPARRNWHTEGEGGTIESRNWYNDGEISGGGGDLERM